MQAVPWHLTAGHLSCYLYGYCYLAFEKRSGSQTSICMQLGHWGYRLLVFLFGFGAPAWPDGGLHVRNLVLPRRRACLLCISIRYACLLNRAFFNVRPWDLNPVILLYGKILAFRIKSYCSVRYQLKTYNMTERYEISCAMNVWWFGYGDKGQAGYSYGRGSPSQRARATAARRAGFNCRADWGCAEKAKKRARLYAGNGRYILWTFCPRSWRD